MTTLDLERAGLMDAIRYDLLDGEKGARAQPIYAELYNLNVYGSSFSLKFQLFVNYILCETQARVHSSSRIETLPEALTCSARSSSSSPPLTRAGHSSSGTVGPQAPSTPARCSKARRTPQSHTSRFSATSSMRSCPSPPATASPSPTTSTSAPSLRKRASPKTRTARSPRRSLPSSSPSSASSQTRCSCPTAV